MLAKIRTIGIDAFKASDYWVEVDVNNGLPKFDIVGLADTAIKESKERIRSAIKNSCLKFPMLKLTVNLAPADIKKEGPIYDLPIAVALLVCVGEIRNNEISDYLFIGELGLDGKTRRAQGIMPLLISARELGYKKVFLPADNAFEASYIKGLDFIPIANLIELVKYLNGSLDIPKIEQKDFSLLQQNEVYNDHNDFKYVKGQIAAKRAMEIAAAGGHNIMMIGPPGAGKTMLARCLPTILPDMTFDEALEVTKLHNIAGTVSSDNGIVLKRPFRSPHHTTTAVTLTGGGAKAKPGEISLAHNGVLFLDELPEYARRTLEVLRQPMEDGVVTVARLKQTIEYPAQFMLVTSMNPCPCGNYGSKNKECRCTPGQIHHYMERLSGPLMDRIDLHVEVDGVKYEELVRNDDEYEEDSATIRNRVNVARKVQLERFNGTKINCNAKMTTQQVREYCRLDEISVELIKRAFEELGLSARAHNRILKVARTIADLEGCENIDISHVAEAISYRSLDKKYWV